MYYGPTSAEKKVEARVIEMIEGLKAGGDETSGDLQTSICKWYNGKVVLSDKIVLENAWDDFEDWRRK